VDGVRVPPVLLAGGRALADLVLPRTCAGCAVPAAVLCRSCAGLLTRPRLAEPRRHPPGFPPTVAAGGYAGPVRPAVLAFKEHGRAELAAPLGAALALAVVTVLRGLPAPPGVGLPGPVVLVPVPSSPAAVRRRGRDHVRELADAAVAELADAGVAAVAAPLLRPASGRRVRDSAGLDAAQRQANLAGRFRLVPGGRETLGTFVLVDDVATSGATLTEAARALGRVGDTPVLAAVVAATPRKSSRHVTVPSPGAITVRGGPEGG
jgi:predicted amidophosphoribosyltransferase